MSYNFITAQEAAEMIQDGQTLGFSGFTAPVYTGLRILRKWMKSAMRTIFMEMV